MTTWNKIIAAYLDVYNPGNPLLSGSSSSGFSGSFYFIQGDKLKLHLYFREKSDSSLSNSTAATLPSDAVIKFAAKLSANLDATTLLFYATDFEKLGSDDNTYYEADLDLNTVELLAAFAEASSTTLNVRCDVEVQNTNNTERITLQFDAIVKQQVYAAESDPVPGTPTYPAPEDLLRKHEDQAWVQFHEGRWWHYIESTGLWYPEIASIVDGVPVFSLGPVGESL